MLIFHNKEYSADDGIIEQELETNGYIKFKNGLILQWGYFETTNPTSNALLIRFPIVFSKKPYFANRIEERNSSESCFNYIKSGLLTSTTVTFIVVGKIPLYWFAMGK